jgi:hypothetical protein
MGRNPLAIAIDSIGPTKTYGRTEQTELFRGPYQSHRHLF